MEERDGDAVVGAAGPGSLAQRRGILLGSRREHVGEPPLTPAFFRRATSSSSILRFSTSPRPSSTPPTPLPLRPLLKHSPFKHPFSHNSSNPSLPLPTLLTPKSSPILERLAARQASTSGWLRRTRAGVPSRLEADSRPSPDLSRSRRGRCWACLLTSCRCSHRTLVFWDSLLRTSSTCSTLLEGPNCTRMGYRLWRASRCRTTTRGTLHLSRRRERGGSGTGWKG